MEPLVIVLVAGSAVLHVAWNVRLKSAGDTLLAATIGLLVGALVIVPIGTAVWWLDGANPLPPEGLALGLVSGLIEAIYFALLAGAYRRGDLSVVYPIARGTAPLILVAVGVGLLGERLGPPDGSAWRACSPASSRSSGPGWRCGPRSRTAAGSVPPARSRSRWPRAWRSRPTRRSIGSGPG